MNAPLPNASSKPFNTDEPFSTYYSLIPGYWLQLLAFTFMYTLCKVTSTMFKCICALPAEPQEHSLSKSPKPKCDLAWLLNTFLLYVVAVREFFLFFFVCTVLVLFIKFIQMNIYEGLIFAPSLFGTHLMVIFSDIHHYPQTNCIASEFCFCFVLMLWFCISVE